MTDRGLPAAPATTPALAEARRAAAFRTAARHSARVRRLRRAIVVGVFVAIGAMVVVTVFDPFGKAIGPVSIQSAAIDGTKVTMTNPKMSGHQKDGRPYTIEAERAVQDLKAPTLFELHDLQARLGMADGSLTRVTAAIGIYNSSAETMDLTTGVHLRSDNGLDALTADAQIAFKANTMTTSKPVTVTMPGRRIAADRMTIVNGGQQVTFEGHVQTEIEPAERTAAAEPAATPVP